MSKLGIYDTKALGHFLIYKTILVCSDCVQMSGVNVGKWHFMTDGVAYCPVGRPAVCEMECDDTVFWKMSWWDSTVCIIMWVFEISYYLAILDWLYRVSRGKCARLRENVPYVKVHRYNPTTYIRSWTVTEIMVREVWKYDSCYTLIDYQIHIRTGRNM